MLGPLFAESSGCFIAHAKIDPDLNPIRDDPRFKAMIAEAETHPAVRSA